MIFPLRVFGSASAKRISAGRASLPISVDTCPFSASMSESSAVIPGPMVTKAQIEWWT